MNLLGHLYFSCNDKELMLANLFGDHFHGRNYSHFPKIIQHGITLHRQIDHYIDHHETVKELRLQLYHDLPKVAGIAIDLYFDHLLAEHWSSYHHLPMDLFLDQFYGFHSQYWEDYPGEFRLFIDQLKTNKWINHYGTTYGLSKSSEGVGKRLSFKNKLSEAPSVYLSNKAVIQDAFGTFMKDAIQQFS